jgi:valyl-tRNA synthetase
VRRLRKEYGIPESERIGIHVFGGSDGFGALAAGQVTAFEHLARVDRVETEPGTGVGAHAVLPNGAELFVPLEGVIDIAQEQERIRAEIERAEGLLAATERKLGNEKFVRNAPVEVVGKERDKAAQFTEQASKLREKLAVLGA